MHNNFSRLSLSSLRLSLSLALSFADDEDVRRRAYTYLYIYTEEDEEREKEQKKWLLLLLLLPFFLPSSSSSPHAIECNRFRFSFIFLIDFKRKKKNTKEFVFSSANLLHKCFSHIRWKKYKSWLYLINDREKKKKKTKRRANEKCAKRENNIGMLCDKNIIVRSWQSEQNFLLKNNTIIIGRVPEQRHLRIFLSFIFQWRSTRLDLYTSIDIYIYIYM